MQGLGNRQPAYQSDDGGDLVLEVEPGGIDLVGVVGLAQGRDISLRVPAVPVGDGLDLKGEIGLAARGRAFL